MGKILAAAGTTLRLLGRDRAGLLVLFLMPAVLVVVITLVQENILELTGQRETELLLLDRDQGAFSRALRPYCQASQLKIRDWGQEPGAEETLRQAITSGRFQAGMIIPQGTSERLDQELARLLTEPRAEPRISESASLELLFDPGAMAGLKAGVLGRVRMAAQAAEMELKAGRLGAMLARQLESLPASARPAFLSETALRQAFGQPLVAAKEQAGPVQQPEWTQVNPVTQNVPAWALFGMFFTAIPMAGALLEERRSGIARRLACLPVSALALIAGRMLAYLGVCCIQFTLIVAIGILLFPRLGLPAFTLPANAALLLPLIAAVSLAACGFGIFLGAVCRSYEQASTLGATSVVVAAALGGVMVPVYAMPPVMQKISLLSPLGWGVHGFAAVLARGGALGAVQEDLIRLLVFAAVLIGISWNRVYRREVEGWWRR